LFAAAGPRLFVIFGIPVLRKYLGYERFSGLKSPSATQLAQPAREHVGVATTARQIPFPEYRYYPVVTPLRQIQLKLLNDSPYSTAKKISVSTAPTWTRSITLAEAPQTLDSAAVIAFYDCTKANGATGRHTCLVCEAALN
jgi:hypothetical protein